MFGPEHRKAPFERAAFEILKVAEKDGRTSVFETLKMFVTTSPSVPLVEEMAGLIRKSIETTPRIIGRKVDLKMKRGDACGKVDVVLRKCFSMVEK